MPDSKSLPFASSKSALFVLAAVALLTSAGGMFAFAQLQMQSHAWDQDRTRLESEVADLETVIDQLESTVGQTAQAKKQLATLNEEVARQQIHLADLARRVIGTQASLDRNIKARRALEEQTQEVRLQLNHAQSNLEPLRQELTTRGQEIKELDAILRRARDQLDKTIDHLAEMRPGTSG